ncbi:MAG: hypothetical protein KC656_30665, partial [Myxococcales bacterium]|nr:hypothetical protein [Myxococcales bacterium]
MGRPRAQLGTKTRVLALVGHTGAGKTQLAEAMLHAGGAVRRQGRVDDGTALLDLDPEERARHGTAFPGVAWLPWGDATVHLVDTPGHDAAAYVTTLARAGTDADLLVVGAPDGVEGLAEAALRRARHVDRPLIVALSKVDRASDLPGLLARMGQLARRPVVGLQ